MVVSRSKFNTVKRHISGAARAVFFKCFYEFLKSFASQLISLDFSNFFDGGAGRRGKRVYDSRLPKSEADG